MPTATRSPARRTMLSTCLLWISMGPLPVQDEPGPVDLRDRVEHHEVENDGVRLHYVTLGEGPLVVLLHGFPDYWYTWRRLMEPLARTHRVAALDLRGYNESDQPEGVDAYAMPHLVADVEAVLLDQGCERASVVGHDWGAAIAWQLAMQRPERVERLAIVSVPHPSGFARELGRPEQRARSEYAYRFQEDGAHRSLTPEGLASWVEPAAREAYVEAFRRSSLEGMLAYYKANFPRRDGSSGNVAGNASGTWPRIACPVLVVHGLRDPALGADGHAGCWNWIDGPTTLLMLPEAGHFVQQDAPEELTRALVGWLDG